MELERLGVATQGTPGSTCHQPDGFHGQTMVGWTIHWWEAQVSENEVVR